MSRQQVSLVWTVTREFDAMEKEKKADGGQFLGGDRIFLDVSEQEIDSSLVPVPNNDEFSADAGPFRPRFLLQELIFAHCPYLPSPSTRGNLLSRADWLSLGGIANTECDIKPMREILNFWTRSVGEEPARDSPKQKSQHAEKNSTVVHVNQRSLPAAIWLRSKQKVPSRVGTSETPGDGRTCTTPPGLCPAH